MMDIFQRKGVTGMRDICRRLDFVSCFAELSIFSLFAGWSKGKEENGHDGCE